MEYLVLFWGWTRNEQSYRKLINSAPVNWEIFAISYEELMTEGRIDNLNETVLNFFEKHNLSRVNLMGHSLGGALALEFAYHHPNKVKRLFLVDSEGIYGHENILQMIRNFLLTHKTYGKQKLTENIKALYRTIRKPLLHARLAHFAHHIDLQEQAKAIKVPTTIIWGEKDHITPLWQGKKLQELIPKSRLVVLPGMDHDWIIHTPEKFWQNI